MAEALIPTWTHRVRAADLRAPLRLSLRPTEAERADVARFLDAEAVSRLEAEVTVAPWLDGLKVTGDWSATVTQICGVSLEPFDSDVRGSFEVMALPLGSPNMPEEDPDTEIDLSTPDPPDVMIDGGVDVAALISEHVSLELGFAPRKPGAEFAPPEAEGPASPFAGLAGLLKPN